MEYEGIWIPGDPKTKGSWVPVRTKAGPIKFRPATKGTSKWCKDARDAIAAQWKHPVIGDGPVLVRLLFLLPRLKTVVRKYPTGKREGDVDKLLRAILDAMTGVAYADDSQVVDAHARKEYTDGETGVWVHVSTDL
jgi:crossover junction endodeoxyribonuclease RusA